MIPIILYILFNLKIESNSRYTYNYFSIHDFLINSLVIYYIYDIKLKSFNSSFSLKPVSLSVISLKTVTIPYIIPYSSFFPQILYKKIRKYNTANVWRENDSFVYDFHWLWSFLVPNTNYASQVRFRDSFPRNPACCQITPHAPIKSDYGHTCHAHADRIFPPAKNPRTYYSKSQQCPRSTWLALDTRASIFVDYNLGLLSQ